MYIRSTGSISPQPTFGHPPFLEDLEATVATSLTCIEPDYKNFIDPKLIRRMSRIIKMGVAAALECLTEAGVHSPDAVITGTAYGCLEDSAAFLSKMVGLNEDLLTPTAFIQSTHNTVAAQIALILQCHSYNNTFVHRGFSFESALLDAVMLMKEGEAENVLVGGVDEITTTSHTILTRLGLYRRKPVSNLDLFSPSLKGTIAGEGAAFFLLSTRHNENDYAVLQGSHTFYKPESIERIIEQLSYFFSSQAIDPQEIDLVITGRNGDRQQDTVYNEVLDNVFNGTVVINFKHLCGEYPTASSFALWMAAHIIRSGKLPERLAESGTAKPIRKVLIYNHYLNIHHSLMLVTKPS
ncbi:MAG: beta-ketoacyl synthase chain length factor [Chitinophagaceae bacterium]|nr:beta-ketoacyl synthase chain length factor [Chitinophagaceae bacterium]